jgi:tRNA dimethylallyltransferase
VSRALEIWEKSGKPQSAWFAEHGFHELRYPVRLLGVHRAPAEIDQRIEDRTARWLAAGWVDEVRGLMAQGFGDARAMGSVGYRQVKDHLMGEIPRDALEGAIVRATRTFVRRQRTWLRDEAVTWVAT